MSDDLDDFGLGPFSKLFSSIVTSTIWREADHVRIVWVTMLATCDKHGVVLAAVPGLAALANVSIENCLDALDRLMSPDPWSRTKDFDGRRIEEVRGGWRLLNYGRYRDRDKATDTRQQYGDGWYVYYVRDGDEVKIGLSKNPWARVKDHQTARPRCRLVGIERGDRALERERHRQFADSRITEGPVKEWFRWTDEIARHVATVATEGRRSNEGGDVGATGSASPSPSASASGDSSENRREDSLQGESAADRVSRFVAAHDFGRFRESVEGYLRASRKPLAVVAELELWLAGELNRKRTDPETLGEALNAYDAATDPAEGFKTNYFAGFVRGVHRGRDRNETSRRNTTEARTIVEEQRAAETRRQEEADRAMVLAFEREKPARFAELKATAEATIGRQYPKLKKTGDMWATLVNDELIRLVREEQR